MTRLRKRSGKEGKQSRLSKTIDDQLKGFGNYREHLASDNTYSDSNNASPLTSSNEDLTSVLASESDSLLLETKGRIPAKLEKKERAEARRRKYRFKPISIRHESSILDQKSSRKSTFFGFYTLFWVTVAFIIVRRLIYNYINHQQLFGMNIASILFRDLVKIALTDLLMYVLTYFGVFLQLAVKHGLIDWDRTGWVIQNVWQTSFLFFFMWFADYMGFPWIGCVFLLLHSLVLVMKQHSYAFYNGYFWKISHDLDKAKKLVAKLSTSTDDKDEEAIERLNEQIDFCAEELNTQSSTVRFPKNITICNYFAYSMFPTLVYQIEYPRNDRVRWSYVAEKVVAIFGVFFLMIMVAENYLFPIAMEAIELRNRSPLERLKAYPFILLDLTPPFILMYLLVFYIIWDAILNAIAELTRFGDREFYGEWWNCITWDQFAKDWNMPVHRFLLRHVYHSSMSAFHLSKMTATVFTFLLSSCVHELVMLVIFKRLRGYLLVLQMAQLPLVAVSRTRFLRDKEVLGNVVFWIGIITGPSLMCSLYLTF